MPAPTPRTTSALVQGIIDTQAGVDLAPFVRTANNLVSRLCVYAASTDPVIVPYTDGYVDSEMEVIERWVAAHFYTIFDNQLSAARAGSVSVGYQYKVDYNLKNSMYGQQAMLLDVYGNLAAYSNAMATKRRIRVDIAWMGIDRSTITPELLAALTTGLPEV